MVYFLNSTQDGEREGERKMLFSRDNERGGRLGLGLAIAAPPPLLPDTSQIEDFFTHLRKSKQ
jgi:hypothetical protein